MKGIKVNTEEVNAILAGDKSQIRLVIKPQPNPKCTLKSRRNKAGNIRWMEWHANTDGKSRFSGIGLGDWKCPLGEVGDLVFVKESFVEGIDKESVVNEDELVDEYIDPEYEEIRLYKASTDPEIQWSDNNDYPIDIPWRPAQHMKQHQSRITLRIKDILVERLQSISCADYFKETGHRSISHMDLDCDTPDPRNDFAAYWNSTHKKPEEKWGANPFVWVINFEVVK